MKSQQEFLKSIDMYSAWDLYCDIMAGRRSDFQYSGETLHVCIERNGTVIITHGTGANRKRAHIRKGQVTCMTDLHGLAACLLNEKKDLWFDRHGDFCTKEEYSPIITPEQYQEDQLQNLIDDVLDISTDDKSQII